MGEGAQRRDDAECLFLQTSLPLSVAGLSSQKAKSPTDEGWA
jgi:hypothetical protein